VGCEYRDWIGLAHDRDGWRTLVSAVMNLRVPKNAGNFLTSCKPVRFSRRTLHHGVRKYSSNIKTNEVLAEVDHNLLRETEPSVIKQSTNLRTLACCTAGLVHVGVSKESRKTLTSDTTSHR